MAKLPLWAIFTSSEKSGSKFCYFAACRPGLGGAAAGRLSLLGLVGTRRAEGPSYRSGPRARTLTILNSSKTSRGTKGAAIVDVEIPLMYTKCSLRSILDEAQMHARHGEPSSDKRTTSSGVLCVQTHSRVPHQPPASTLRHRQRSGIHRERRECSNRLASVTL